MILFCTNLQGWRDWWKWNIHPCIHRSFSARNSIISIPSWEKWWKNKGRWCYIHCQFWLAISRFDRTVLNLSISIHHHPELFSSFFTHFEFVLQELIIICNYISWLDCCWSGTPASMVYFSADDIWERILISLAFVVTAGSTSMIKIANYKCYCGDDNDCTEVLKTDAYKIHNVCAERQTGWNPATNSLSFQTHGMEMTAMIFL